MFKTIIKTFLLLTVVMTSHAFADPMLLEVPEKENKNQMEFTETTKKHKFEYPSAIVVNFVGSCTQHMVGQMGLPAQQAYPLAINMCSCLMDQFRSDFSKDAFIKGGKKLAIAMGPQYGAFCKAKFNSKSM